MTVLKFGGSSVADAGWIRRVVDIVTPRIAEAPIVVASAMGKTTDRLVEIASEGARGRLREAEAILEGVAEHHRNATRELFGGSLLEEVLGTVDALLSELNSVIHGLVLVRECTPRSFDAILSFGERLSTVILSAAFRSGGVDAILLDSRRLIVTDDEFSSAMPDFEATNRTIREQVHPAPGAVLVLQGFIASTKEGVTTTLGRGGSDFTATIVGAALGADAVEIWTDVNGIMTSDPRVVPSAQTLTEISYAEAAELAFFGAKVVHPFTIEPAIELGIPVWVRNTGNPEHPGTRISESSVEKGVRALAAKKDVTLVSVQSYRMLNAHGFLASIFTIFAEARISVDLVATSEVSVSMTLDRTEGLGSVVKRLEDLGTVEVETRRGIVCLVGKGLWRDSAVVARVFNTLEDVPLRMISLGSSDTNLSLVVAEDDADRAVRKLHAAFFD
ncbi:MAG: lysine-sensitive aspartokinase 3 [Spirochaetaceae bacterium]